MVVPDGDGQWYLGEDFAFSERARQAGFDIVADTRVRLHHIGKYAYSWEDSGISPARYATFTLNLG
jgi:GT2 family glycosyltransferase